MRIALSIVCLVFATLLVTPASAQLRQDAVRVQAPVQLYDQGGAAFSLNRYFSPEHFRMSHSVEMSTGGYGGTVGMYTNSMMWQFSSKLAARVDVAMAYSPDARPGYGMTREGDTRVFLRNAELAFRPKENMLLHLSVRQSPFGYYASPWGRYGYGGYGGYGFGYDSHYGTTGGDLFWNSRLK